VNEIGHRNRSQANRSDKAIQGGGSERNATLAQYDAITLL